MRRRELIAIIGNAAAVSSLLVPVARAQEAGRIYRVGVIAGPAREAPRIVTFFDELKGLGFVEGHNLLLSALVADQVDLILTHYLPPKKSVAIVAVATQALCALVVSDHTSLFRSRSAPRFQFGRDHEGIRPDESRCLFSIPQAG